MTRPVRPRRPNKKPYLSPIPQTEAVCRLAYGRPCRGGFNYNRHFGYCTAGSLGHYDSDCPSCAVAWVESAEEWMASWDLANAREITWALIARLHADGNLSSADVNMLTRWLGLGQAPHTLTTVARELSVPRHQVQARKDRAIRMCEELLDRIGLLGLVP